MPRPSRRARAPSFGSLARQGGFSGSTTSSWPSLYGKGFVVRGSAQKKRELAEELLEEDNYVRLNQEEKRYFLFLELAAAPGMVKLASLGHALNSCDSGVSRSIDILNGELAGFGASIERRRGFGTLLRGPEWDIRKALLHFSTRNLDENEYIGRVLESASGVEGGGGRARTFTSTLFERLAPPALFGRPVSAAEAEFFLDGALPYFTRVLRRVRTSTSASAPQTAQSSPTRSSCK